MTASSEESIRQLTQTVGTLAESVARGEARNRALASMARWAGVAFVCLTALVFYVGSDAMRKAQAANGDPGSVAQQLAQLNQTLGQMAQGMGQIMQNPGLGKLIDNGGVLAERLKQDSDALRLLLFCQAVEQPLPHCIEAIKAGHLQVPGMEMDAQVLARLEEAPEASAAVQNLENIQQISKTLRRELNRLNQVLAAVPEMRHEMGMMRTDMRAMTANMGVMAGSMGSTMGRMGSWLPW
jgi:methyl-accepting chemotaxis protein